MQFAFLFLATARVACDECQDFCAKIFGESRCTFGTYCKDNGYCHRLQWTASTRDSICIFGDVSDPACLDKWPVTCIEARRGLSATSTSTTTTPRRICSAINTRRGPSRPDSEMSNVCVGWCRPGVGRPCAGCYPMADCLQDRQYR